MNDKYFLSANFFNGNPYASFYGSFNLEDGFFSGQGPFKCDTQDEFILKGYRLDKNSLPIDIPYVVYPSQEYLDNADSLLFGFFDKNNSTSIMHFLTKIGKKKNFIGRYSGFQIHLDHLPEQIKLNDLLKLLNSSSEESNLNFAKPYSYLDSKTRIKYKIFTGYLNIKK